MAYTKLGIRSGEGGAWRPKDGLHAEFVTRMAKYFRRRVDAYQLYHEVNLQGMMKDADSKFIIHEIFKNGARAIRQVYKRANSSRYHIHLRDFSMRGLRISRRSQRGKRCGCGR